MLKRVAKASPPADARPQAGGRRRSSTTPMECPTPPASAEGEGAAGRANRARAGGRLVELPPCSYPRIISYAVILG